MLTLFVTRAPKNCTILFAKIRMFFKKNTLKCGWNWHGTILLTLIYLVTFSLSVIYRQNWALEKRGSALYKTTNQVLSQWQIGAWIDLWLQGKRMNGLKIIGFCSSKMAASLWEICSRPKLMLNWSRRISWTPFFPRNYFLTSFEKKNAVKETSAFDPMPLYSILL